MSTESTTRQSQSYNVNKKYTIGTDSIMYISARHQRKEYTIMKVLTTKNVGCTFNILEKEPT